jgi:hypothetical protein
VGLQSQCISQEEKQSENDIFSLQLSTSSSKLCLGATTLPLTLEVKNISSKVVKAETTALWQDITIILTSTEPGREKRIKVSPVPESERQYVTLEQGRSYWDTVKYPLEDDWFRSVGSFIVQVSYSGADSNELSFEIVECKK